MINQYLPSKKFIKIALSFIVLFVLIYFGFLYKKTYNAITNPEIITTSGAVSDMIEEDKDSDGVRDFEEALWGTNPDDPMTFDIPDKQYIETKRIEIAKINKSSDGELLTSNETEQIAREFLSTILALKESNGLNQENISKLAEKFASDIGQNAVIPPVYDLQDLKTGSDTTIGKQTYYQKISKATELAKKGGMGTELKTIADFLENTSLDTTPILKLSETYKTLEKTLAEIPVPPSAKSIHLTYLNNSSAMSVIFKNIPNIYDNSIVGLVGIAEYQIYEKNLEAAVTELVNYFKMNGILK